MRLLLKNFFYFLKYALITLYACTSPSAQDMKTSNPISVYEDLPYLQDYSIKYYLQDSAINLKQVFSDRNNSINILSDQGLMHPTGGQFLYPGRLINNSYYRPLQDKEVSHIGMLNDQFIYLDNKAVFSNAWAGRLFIQHDLPNATLFAIDQNFNCWIANHNTIIHLSDNEKQWEKTFANEKIIDLQLSSETGEIFVLTQQSLYKSKNADLVPIAGGKDLTCFTLYEGGTKAVVGSNQGYGIIDLSDEKAGETSEIQMDKKLPWSKITTVAEINGHLWFGSAKGAFMLREDGKFNYYYGERWLPGNNVTHISAGEKDNILVLTNQGLAEIHFEEMTLAQKAEYFEHQVRDRHIRHGFNSSLGGMEKGNVDTGILKDSDNDGLWTSMYLGGQIFRYAATKSEEALQNCREALEAMERLYDINPVPGFPSRSFERSGYIEHLGNPERWQHSPDPEWDWKATTSSDEAIGHIFAFGVAAELLDDPELKQKAITLIDTLMQHVVDNDFYLVDYDGEPTTWGRWHPDYVNARPKMVGDRKLNSSNIVAMLQTAYHFTNKEIYKEKARDLMIDHGYLENLLRPIREIGSAPEDADEWSRMLSQSWNHSDDEMYYMGYWGLYRYPFADSLQPLYRKAILDHWEAERPEKEGAWNIFTAITGINDFDLEEAVWYLKEHPLDLIDWKISNSHRQDLDFIEPNFREQTTAEVLPPDERPIQRHNANMFSLDRTRGNGTSEHSAGDIWLLPYWMGRYLGVISSDSTAISKVNL